jgi:hypothetical protein
MERVAECDELSRKEACRQHRHQLGADTGNSLRRS